MKGVQERLFTLILVLIGLQSAVAQSPREPTHVDARVGDTVRFEATAEGSELVYQWRKDGSAILGATGSIFTPRLSHPSETGLYDVVASNKLGVATSEGVRLSVSPILLTSMVTSTLAGQNVTLNLAAGFSPQRSATYQWRLNGLNVPGATNDFLVVTNPTETDFGNYTLLITSFSRESLTAPTLLTQSGAETSAPEIVAQPLDVNLAAGSPLALSVTTTDVAFSLYQWKRNGINIVGATGRTLLIDSVKEGLYSVMVNNSIGGTFSRNAVVEIGSGSSRLANVSSIGFIRSDRTMQTTGLAISGPASKRLLVRAVGPTLRSFGINDAVGDPFLEVFDAAGRTIDRNDDWSSIGSNTSAVRNASAAIGAYALVEGSSDAALIVNLSSGTYTLRTTSANNSTGKTMTEIYDLETAGPGDSRLVNLSRTDSIQVASDLMLSGFVVDGSVAKTLMIRAVGPTLRSLGITDALNKPHLKIFDGANRLVTSSEAWETNGVSDGIILASARIGAFALPRGSGDCSVVTTLPPGSYTVHVTGTARDTGNVLLEVYEVP